MKHESDYSWYLKVENTTLKRQLESYRSGHKYQSLRDEYESCLRKKDMEICRLNQEVARAHAETVTNRKHWEEVSEDLYAETNREVKKANKKAADMEKQAIEAICQRDKALEEAKKWRLKYYELSERTEELEGENKKLKAQVNKDFENSSIPSSQQGPKRKRIPNSREKTDRKPGGQKGHEGHRLTQRKPTQSYRIPDPEKYVEDPNYYATGELVKRQKIFLKIGIEVIEYTARVFRNRKTGSRVHADFPEGYDTDISYDASVKALSFLLANEGDMSVGKIKILLNEISAGAIDMAESTINGLCREFSQKTQPELDAIKRDILVSPVVNVDFTNANINGNSKQVLIIASPSTDSCLYIARDHKGHKGIEGTPIADYVGTLVHDHDISFYKYGIRHQECAQHNMRYLTGSIENEPERNWNIKMRDLVREMLHYRNNLGDNELDTNIVADFEKRYDEILLEARKEYMDDPPGNYYREGYNLYLRLEKYKESELLFLHDKRVPANNSLAERLARQYKRKQRQAIALRSDTNFISLCDDLSVIQTLRQKGVENLYTKVSDIFNRSKETVEKSPYSSKESQ